MATKRIKKGTWIKADRVRIVNNPGGGRTLEIQRYVKKRSTPTKRNGNGYVVYPSNRGFMKLSAARRAAKAEAKREGSARVENVDTQRTVARY